MTASPLGRMRWSATRCHQLFIEVHACRRRDVAGKQSREFFAGSFGEAPEALALDVCAIGAPRERLPSEGQKAVFCATLFGDHRQLAFVRSLAKSITLGGRNPAIDGASAGKRVESVSALRIARAALRVLVELLTRELPNALRLFGHQIAAVVVVKLTALDAIGDASVVRDQEPAVDLHGARGFASIRDVDGPIARPPARSG